MDKMNRISYLFFIFPLLMLSQNRLRDHGVEIGVLQPGTYNAITDVPGVQVGHSTIFSGENIRTGVTAILPHSGNIFQ